MSQRAVLLVGSPRPRGQSTSDALARYLSECLADRGVTPSLWRVTRTCKEPGIRQLLAALDEADMLVLASPVYVDSLPYLVTRALERIAEHRAAAAEPRECAMLAIVNCGFPEARHTRVALDICRLFAGRARLGWIGGLGLGGGGVINGKRLQDLGWLSRHVRRSLDLAAHALIAGRPLPAEAEALMAQPVLPDRLYTMFAAFGWFRDAWRHGTLGDLGAKPFTRRPIL
jgi:NADPH-dependent FMN reductase